MLVIDELYLYKPIERNELVEQRTDSVIIEFITSYFNIFLHVTSIFQIFGMKASDINSVH